MVSGNEPQGIISRGERPPPDLPVGVALDVQPDPARRGHGDDAAGEPEAVDARLPAGAYLTSIGLGLAIVFALQESSAVSTSQNTISPAADIVLGALALLIAFVLATDRDRGLRERKARRKREKQGEDDGDEKESLPLRLLGRGSPRVAFAVGVVLSFPGASYLAGLGHIDSLEASTGQPPCSSSAFA